jgi:lysophospholipase
MVTSPKIAQFNRREIPSYAIEGRWKAKDGWSIRRIDFPAKPGPSQKQRGSLLFLAGRGDHYEKYLETLDYWATKGWSVTSIDWRGQGQSGRLLQDQYVGHIDDFSTWIGDLEHFYSNWVREQSGPHVVVAHSMGGHLLMRAMAEKKIAPDAAVFSAPMLSIQSGGLPLGVTAAYAKLMEAIGKGDDAAWKASEKPLSGIKAREKMLSHDPNRYADELEWWKIRPDVKLGPPSWHWVDRAVASIRSLDAPGIIEAIETPIFMLATSVDQLVSPAAIQAYCKRLPNAELLMLGKEAAHELLREADPVRDKCLNAIDAFLDRNAPAA